MHTLTLKPGLRRLALAVFGDETDDPIGEWELALEQFDQSTSQFPNALFQRVRDLLAEAGIGSPDLIAVRGLFGGERFPEPVVASEMVLADLELLAPQAPLHVPRLIELVKAARHAFPAAVVLVVFETSFFVRLPERERRYGLDPEMMDSESLRRYGFHGVFHEAACKDAARHIRLSEPRVLSICLEPRPELAACLGRWPVMVTGGSTPIEGLPGETSCGDLDPSVVLKLAHDTRWGPEMTGSLLTRESGIHGLVGRRITLAELLHSNGGQLQLAKDVFLYSLLRACGAGMAGMGGLDAIVYSGRYAASGTALHAWLNERLRPVLRGEVPCLIHTRSLAQHLRDIAHVTAREARQASFSAEGGIRSAV